MLILTRLFAFVKDFSVAKILFIPLWVYRHKRDDRILKIGRVTFGTDAQYQLIPFAVDFKLFENVGGVRHIGVYDIIGL